MSESGTFCFVHAADLHLDTPFSGIHEVSPFVANELREASLAAFDSIVDLALSRKAAFLVVAGDVYDGAERGLRAQLRFASGLELLASERIPSFVVHGNHDPLAEGWAAVSDWPDDVTVFGSNEVEVHPVESDGQVLATVQGISYAHAETTENLALRFQRPEGPGLHVGVLHCNVGGDRHHGNYSPCSLEDLRRSGLDYFALGHIHQRQVVAEATRDGMWAVYPGNSQARSPKPSERGAKGAVVVHVVDFKVREVEFVSCDRVRFEEIDCPIDDLADCLALQEQLGAIAGERLSAADGRSLILRGRLVGRGTIHSDLARPGALEALLSELRGSLAEHRPFVWWDELVDQSRPVLDREEILLRNDFASDLLRAAEEAMAQPASLAALVGDLVKQAPKSMTRTLGRLAGDEGRLSSIATGATAIALDSVLEEA